MSTPFTSTVSRPCPPAVMRLVTDWSSVGAHSQKRKFEEFLALHILRLDAEHVESRLRHGDDAPSIIDHECIASFAHLDGTDLFA